MNKEFKKIAVGYPYEDRKDKVCKVELWSGWVGNIDQETRENMVATIASLSYGNEKAKNSKALYKRLQVLKHESIFEFINFPNFVKRAEVNLRNNPELPKFIDSNDESNLDILIEKHKESIVTFKITLPIFIARQFMRHRCFSYLEMSRRYVTANKKPFNFINLSKQNVDVEKVGNLKFKAVKDLMDNFYEQSIEVYRALVNSGVAPEFARAVVPVGAYTTFYVQGDLECLTNFFRLRLKKDAQKEFVLVAKSMLALIREHQPALYKHLEKVLEDKTLKEIQGANNVESK